MLSSLLLLVIFNGPLVAAADRLVLLSPHWKGIEDEFERAFKAHHLRETGRTVEFEWLDVGGTSEVLRFIRSEFNNKPAGIGIDVFLGAGLNPISLSKRAASSPLRFAARALEKHPTPLGRRAFVRSGLYVVRGDPGGVRHRLQQSRSTAREPADHHNSNT